MCLGQSQNVGDFKERFIDLVKRPEVSMFKRRYEKRERERLFQTLIVIFFFRALDLVVVYGVTIGNATDTWQLRDFKTIKHVVFSACLCGLEEWLDFFGFPLGKQDVVNLLVCLSLLIFQNFFSSFL